MPHLWLRASSPRSVVIEHLRQIRGRFRAAGWTVHASEQPPESVDGALAVLDDPWLEPLPRHAERLASVEPSAPPRWRVPRISGLSGPQGWPMVAGPYTLRDYERAIPRARTRSRLQPLGEVASGFAVAPPSAAPGLLRRDWPPGPAECLLDPDVRIFRHTDPADHERTELDPHVPEAARTVVDVGCGSGRLGARHQRSGRRVIGIEPDWDLARAAARRLDTVLCTTARDGLSSLRDGVDCIVFSDVLEHLTSPEEILGLAASRLSKKGRVVVSLPNAAWAPIVRALAAGRWDVTLSGVQARDHYAYFTPSSFARLASEAGLVVEREIPLPAPLPLSLRLWSHLLALSVGGSAKHLGAPQWIGVLAPRVAKR